MIDYVFSFKVFVRANLEHACSEYLHQTLGGGGGAEGAGGGAEGGWADGGVSKHIIRLIVGLLFRNMLPSPQYASFTADNIFHLDVRYVCMLVQCFEPH